MERYDFACSIVTYEHSIEEIKKLLDCFERCSLNFKLYLIDNSTTDLLGSLQQDYTIEYIYNNDNLGYGKAHNIGLRKSIDLDTKYHLIINPDVEFPEGSIEKLFAYMETQPKVGSVMPNVLYGDGSLQRLCKLLPTPMDLFGRRFLPDTDRAKNQNRKYELHDFDYKTILNVPCLSGCFMFLRTSVLKEVGLFDDRYFMYLEDYDLCRRIHRKSRTEFYPDVTIIHGHNKESYKSAKLLKIHIQSAVKYFNKWGWIFDKERQAFNQKVLEKINSSQ